MSLNSSAREVTEWECLSHFSQYFPVIGVNLVSLLHLFYLIRQEKRQRNKIYAIIYRIRTVIVTTSLISHFIYLVISLQTWRTDDGLSEGSTSLVAARIGSSIWIILTYALLTFLSGLEYHKGATSHLLFFSYFFLVAREFPSTQVIILDTDYESAILVVGNVYRTPYLVVLVAVSVLLCIIDMFIPVSMYVHPSRHPEDISIIHKGNFFSKFWVLWIVPKLVSAWRKPLIDPIDLYEYPKDDDCQNTLKRVLAAKDESTGLLTGRTMTRQVLRATILQEGSTFIYEICSTLIAVNRIFILRKLFQYFEAGGEEDKMKGIYLALAISLRGLSEAWLGNRWYFTSHYAAARVRTVTSALIMSKFLRMSSSARLKHGRNISTMMTLDVHKVSLLFTEGNTLHYPFIYYPFYMVMMWQAIGPAALMGILITLLSTLFKTVFLARLIHSQKKKEMEVKSSRVRLLQSLLSGIKVIKSYAWEIPFMKKILTMRRNERSVIWKVFLLNICGRATAYLGNTLMLGSMLPIYMATSDEPRLTADQIFILLAAFNNLITISFFITPILGVFSQAYVSLKRIEDFLDSDDDYDDSAKYESQNSNQQDGRNKSTLGHGIGPPIRLIDASFEWGTEGFKLNRISLTVAVGELVAVVGKVGCGKTSLLHAILGEMHLVSGESNKHGSLAYLPQEPWILNATFRENILLGSSFDSDRYWRIIKACALDEDLDTFPNGELTEIGERGITISGGQKHRLSLARAVYADADVYLIDDPLSAVDRKVSSHLLDKVFCQHGILANKTRVLVTHAIDCLDRMDRIVLMDQGEIVEIGDYKQIMEHHSLTDHLKLPVQVTSSHKGTGPEVTTWSKKASNTQAESSKLMTDEVTQDNLNIGRSFLIYGRNFGYFWILATLVLVGVTVTLEITKNFHVSSWTRGWSDEPSTAGQDNTKNLLKLIAYTFTTGMSAILTIVVVTVGCVRALKLLHTSALRHTFGAKVSFFDTTPFGRLLNWFTQDLNDLEGVIPTNMWTVVNNLIKVLIVMISCIWITPALLLGFLLAFIVFHLTQSLHSVYVVKIMRVYGASRSRLFSLFNEMVDGVVSIHAYNKQEHFFHKFIHLLNESTKPLWHMAAAKVLVILIINALGNTLLFLVILVAILTFDRLDPQIVVAVVYTAYTMLSSMALCVLSISEVKRSMVAVERLASTRKIPSEELNSRESKGLPLVPFSNGSIEFHHYSGSYQQTLGSVLKDISFHIPQGEKVGIVGRTGSGKTTITYALLRMLDAVTGHISINSTDITNMTLNHLRSAVTVVSQDPVIFEVSIRDNLDPLRQCGDEEMWAVLEKTGLKDHIEKLPAALDTLLMGANDEFSLGQKQLLCLARAILRKPAILILDETTASVDIETDNTVQEVLRSSLHESTLITIAHRLHTVIDYDKILVMDTGRVAEYGDPRILLLNHSSHFYRLVNAS